MNRDPLHRLLDELTRDDAWRAATHTAAGRLLRRRRIWRRTRPLLPLLVLAVWAVGGWRATHRAPDADPQPAAAVALLEKLRSEDALRARPDQLFAEKPLGIAAVEAVTPVAPEGGALTLACYRPRAELILDPAPPQGSFMRSPPTITSP